jgi:hypothetical protein
MFLGPVWICGKKSAHDEVLVGTPDRIYTTGQRRAQAPSANQMRRVTSTTCRRYTTVQTNLDVPNRSDRSRRTQEQAWGGFIEGGA